MLRVINTEFLPTISMHVKCIVNENKESHQRLSGIRSLDIDLLAIWKSETKADTHLNFACLSHLMLSLRL